MGYGTFEDHVRGIVDEVVLVHAGQMGNLQLFITLIPVLRVKLPVFYIAHVLYSIHLAGSTYSGHLNRVLFHA